jgi:hypothetical protein
MGLAWKTLADKPSVATGRFLYAVFMILNTFLDLGTILAGPPNVEESAWFKQFNLQINRS